MDLRANTKLEIKGSVGKQLNKTHDDLIQMEYPEIELVLLSQLVFLDLSEGNQYQLLTKLLTVSSQGIRKCVLSKLKILIDDASRESKIVVVNDDAQIRNENTPGNANAVVGIQKRRTEAPGKFDPRFDGFDQSKYLTKFNAH